MYISFIGLSIDIEEEDRIIAALAAMESVVEVYTMMGQFEVLVKVKADSIKALEATITELLGLHGVQRIYNFLAVEQKKGWH